MVAAFERHGGVKDSYVTQCDTSHFKDLDITARDIPSIKNYYHFEYGSDNRIQVFKYFKIGNGKAFFLNKLDLKDMLNDMNQAISMDWKESEKRSATQSKKSKKRILNQEFSWTDIQPEVLTPVKEDKIHFDEDIIKSLYVKLLQLPYINTSSQPKPPQKIEDNCNEKRYADPKDRWESSAMGFAIRTTKTLAKITPKHKEIMDQLFNEGEINRKYTPDEAVKIIREKENPDKTKVFNPEQWLTAV